MMGGRRCGKTTLLATIRERFNKILHHDVDEGEDLLRLTTEVGDITHLNDAMDALSHYFSDDYDAFSEFPTDDNPNGDATHTTFHLQPLNKEKGLDICFIDVPGEWFSRPDKEQEIQEYIQNAQVLILAIDTPALFGEEGFYAEYFNRIKNISTHITNVLCGDFMNCSLANKMLLFMPLKCERWAVDSKGGVNRDGMEEIRKKVRIFYDEPLINELQKGTRRSMITMAILPIVTVREFRWLKFSCILNGELIDIHKENGDPRYFAPKADPNSYVYSIYTYRSPALFEEAKQNGYGSYYCEQPLIYTLVYLLRLTLIPNIKLPSEKVPWWDIWRKLKTVWEEFILLFSGNTAFNEELRRLKGKKMLRQNGFEIIQNPLGI